MMRASKRPVNHQGPTGAGVSGAGKRLDTGRQARNLASHGIRMDHALTGRALHFGLRVAQGLRRNRFVAAGERRFDLLYEGAHAGFPSAVAGGAGNGLTDALARGCGIGHAFFDHNVKEPDKGRGPGPAEDAGSTHRPPVSQGRWQSCDPPPAPEHRPVWPFPRVRRGW